MHSEHAGEGGAGTLALNPRALHSHDFQAHVWHFWLCVLRQRGELLALQQPAPPQWPRQRQCVDGDVRINEPRVTPRVRQGTCVRSAADDEVQRHMRYMFVQKRLDGRWTTPDAHDYSPVLWTRTEHGVGPRRALRARRGGVDVGCEVTSTTAVVVLVVPLSHCP